MGTPIAPTIANFFMYNIETAFFTTQTYLPLLYRRYIDDIFLVWTHGPETLHTFLTEFNQYHPNIKLTWQTSLTEVHYLDLTIYLKHHIIYSTSYIQSQPTLINTYMPIHTIHRPRINQSSMLKHFITLTTAPTNNLPSNNYTT